jgi:hypothetical protein
MARYGSPRDRGYDREMGDVPRRRPMGQDPNYRGGRYLGERFDESGASAPYGRYRAEHADELGSYGGARGRRTGAGMMREAPRSQPSGPFAPPPRGGGRSDPRGRYRPDDAPRGYRFAPRGGKNPDDRRFDAGRTPPYDATVRGRGPYRGRGFGDGYLSSGF